MLDNVNAQLSKLDIEGPALERRREHYGGVVQVHRRFPSPSSNGVWTTRSGR
ncbi:hypothetical protein [Spirillospora sp. NPDC047279]|uniref:hypothetical protein n=1 Tax=Spirillospora sp. NPDC047279 TaxID=3155478 RepID=UPI0033CB31C9